MIFNATHFHFQNNAISSQQSPIHNIQLQNRNQEEVIQHAQIQQQQSNEQQQQRLSQEVRLFF